MIFKKSPEYWAGKMKMITFALPKKGKQKVKP